MQHHFAYDTNEYVPLLRARGDRVWALGRPDGKISYHRDGWKTLAMWRFGATVFRWDGGRWRIWTSAGEF
jgi:hypothetical protein